jgi:hypothetical protein
MFHCKLDKTGNSLKLKETLQQNTQNLRPTLQKKSLNVCLIQTKGVVHYKTKL